MRDRKVDPCHHLMSGAMSLPTPEVQQSVNPRYKLITGSESDGLAQPGTLLVVSRLRV
jgi:hypothetical protein